VGSSAATRLMVPDPVSPLGRAPTLPRARGSGPRLPTQEGSGTAMCRTALDPVSPTGRAPGATACPVTFCGPWALRIKKGIADLATKLGSCVSMTHPRVAKAHASDKRCSNH
jgi:hypothetical protein